MVPSLVLCLPCCFLLCGLLALFSAAVRLGHLTLAFPLEYALRRNLRMQISANMTGKKNTGQETHGGGSGLWEGDSGGREGGVT